MIDQNDYAHRETFKRGQRVRYVGNLVPSWKGKTGTITSIGWRLNVRFDGQEYSQPCYPCNLERLRKGDTQ